GPNARRGRRRSRQPRRDLRDGGCAWKGSWDMSAESDTMNAVTAVHASAVEAHAAALAALEQARGQFELCEAAAAAAASAYTDATEPTPALAKASLGADDALAL